MKKLTRKDIQRMMCIFLAGLTVFSLVGSVAFMM